MNQSRTLILKFLSIVSVIVVTYCLVGSVGFFIFARNHETQAAAKPTIDIYAGTDAGEAAPVSAAEEQDEGLFSDIFTAPVRTNFVVMGVDQSGLLADVIIAASFNSETGQLFFVNIPRDTYVKMPASRVKQLQDLGRRVPSSGGMKINSVHSYAGTERGGDFIKSQVSELLGVKLDFFVEVNLSAFRKIVDGIGGVTMTIRPQGLYYEDPEQDLSIALPGGTYTLTGKQAEGLVRYRNDYARADLQRIEVQQDFLKAMIKQVMNRETLLQNAPTLISTFLSYVKTDFNAMDLPKYLGYLDKLSGESIVALTLPGEPTYTNGGWYFLQDETAMRSMVQEIFYGAPLVSEEDELDEAQPSATESGTSGTADSLKDRIQILNGGETAGIAGRTAERLKDLGYNVTEIGDYQGTQQDYTRIVARTDKEAQEYMPLFEGAKTVLDARMPEDFDIIIILGRNEGGV